MNCQECESLFDDMIDRRVKEPMRQRMELHLSRCGHCRSVLERRRKSHALMFQALNGAVGDMHLPKDFADRLVAECRRRPKWSLPALPKWALIAASLVIMAGFVFAAVEVIEAMAGSSDEGDRGTTPAPLAESTSPISDNPPAPDGATAESDNSIVPDGATAGNDDSITPISTTDFQHMKNQGEEVMKKVRAAAARLTVAMGTALFATANGEEYQFIISGDPVAAETVGSASASSATSALTSGTLAEGFVLVASSFEARSRTLGESAMRALRADKFRGITIRIR